LLLLDEPFAALDRPLRMRIAGWLLSHLRERNLPFLLVTHDQSDVSSLMDEIWEISDGRLRLR
jgi:molybdate transport system ATP-binding protein